VAIVAVSSFGREARQPPAVELSRPDQHHTWIGDRALFVGFPASPDRVPWSRVSEPERARLVHGALDGSVRLAGGWTLVAAQNGELVVRTDPYGSRPLFIRLEEASATVADDIWSVLDSAPQLDPVGVADFLIVGHHLGKRTFFADVSTTEPDSLLRIADTGMTFESLNPPGPLSVGVSLDDAVDALENALLRVYDPYADIGSLLIPLSGGLDSRVLLALAVDLGLDVHAWTFTLVRHSKEEALARAVARSLGVPHTVSYVSEEELRSAAPAFIRATSAQKSLEHLHGYPARRDPPDRFSVEASGIAGGMVCGGALLLPADTTPTKVEHASAMRYLAGHDPRRLQMRLPGVPQWGERLDDLVSDWYAAVNKTPRLADFIFLRNRPSRFSFWGPISLRDRFDYTAPFLDEDLIRCCYGLPEAWHRDANAYRELILRRWPSLAAIAWEKTGTPLSRSPGRLARRARALRRWYQIGRPIAFYHRKVYERAFSALIDEAVPSMTPTLTGLGIDVQGLREDFGPSAQTLDLRLASIFVAIQQAARSRASVQHVA
jgi:hypothetical protein